LREAGIKNIVKPRNFDILITPYHSAVSASRILGKIGWETLIVDEAHKMKNDETILA
jgi:SWI/SNF-related matrix-associated actin-dependent regulator of chromatin subfamily A member 5